MSSAVGPPNSPFVCSYHCVTSAMGAAHISSARPVIKLKVSSINHTRLLLSLSILPSFLSRRRNEGFRKSPAGGGAGERGGVCTRAHMPAHGHIPARQWTHYQRLKLPVHSGLCATILTILQAGIQTLQREKDNCCRLQGKDSM